MTISINTRNARTRDRVAPADSLASVSAPSLGPWQLVRPLGIGSWTQVFQARPVGCPVDWPSDYAVKILQPEHRDDPVAAEMLRREYAVARAVSHPHLTTILSAQISKPPLFLAMPFLPGGTIRELLDVKETGCHSVAVEKTPLATPHALWLARQVAEALQAMHHAGWRHGDVKPSNIFVSPQGHVTLIDLGFSQPLTETNNTDANVNPPLAATPAYAAPEAFLGMRHCNAHSDVYSLGITLFEMLTGHKPFTATDTTDLAAAHLQQPPPELRHLAPHQPPRVARLLRKLLAKEPLRRPTSDELVTWLAELEIDTLTDRQTA